MRVIIHGIKDIKLRMQIEREMNDTCILVGYMQGLEEDYKFKNYEYKPFLTLDNLEDVDFDLIILAAGTQEESDKVFSRLVSVGIPKEKILPYYYFAVYQGGISFRNPLRDYDKIAYNFPVWILGMSYAVRGLYAQYLECSAYKFCSPGMDLHYHFNVLKEIMKKQPSTKPKVIVIDMPYYIFNFDVSRTKENKIRMFSLYEDFEDWHHFGEYNKDQYWLESYHKFERLFREKRERNPSVVSNNYEVWPVKTIEEEKNVKCGKIKNSHVWDIIHEETIEENVKIFQEMLEELYNWDKSIRVVALVIPHSCLEYEENIVNICRMKERYNNILEDFSREQLEIADFYSLYFEEEQYFRDEQHLNTLGGIAFSKHFNQWMKDKGYNETNL